MIPMAMLIDLGRVLCFWGSTPVAGLQPAILLLEPFFLGRCPQAGLCQAFSLLFLKKSMQLLT